jgi:hypothetical protein
LAHRAWVHIEREGEAWREAIEFSPPHPLRHGAKGFPVLCVESSGFVFRFSSNEQLAQCIRTLSRKPSPTTRQLCAARPGDAGPNGHWLSRLPAHIKSPKARGKVVQQLSLFVGQVGA